MSQSGERQSVLKRSEHNWVGNTQGGLMDAQADEILGFEKVLSLLTRESTGKAFQALANWISCDVFCES